MNRSGEWVNNLNGNAQYKSFKPAPLPPNSVLQINSDMVKKLVEAYRHYQINRNIVYADYRDYVLFLTPRANDAKGICDELWDNGVSYENQREYSFQLYAKMVSCYHYFN